MSIRDMTKENITKLKSQIDKIKDDIKTLEKKTPSDLWKEDLIELKNAL